MKKTILIIFLTSSSFIVAMEQFGFSSAQEQAMKARQLQQIEKRKKEKLFKNATGDPLYIRMRIGEGSDTKTFIPYRQEESLINRETFKVNDSGIFWLYEDAIDRWPLRIRIWKTRPQEDLDAQGTILDTSADNRKTTYAADLIENPTKFRQLFEKITVVPVESGRGKIIEGDARSPKKHLEYISLSKPLFQEPSRRNILSETPKALFEQHPTELTFEEESSEEETD